MRRILMVDDEKDFCFFIKKNLEKAGDFFVETCNDGQSGVEKAKEMKPDLILLDIMMPGMDGTLVADIISNDPKLGKTPFIFMTAVVKEDEVPESSNMIANRWFLSKPVSAKKLIDLIDQIIPKAK